MPLTTQNKLVIVFLSLVLFICNVDLGYASNTTSSAQALHHAKFRVPGASCISCIRRLEREVRQTPGVILAHAVKTSPFIMELYYDSNILKLTTIFDSLKAEGYIVSDVLNEPVNSIPALATSKDVNPEERLKSLPADAPPLVMP
ncbi:MAG: heavy-metal-associated domain-containing protein [Candidatus Obscuribacterales bacterium]|nr:heavy-metal-associated domain-containing protein [Candidatus Obscuribacterales bacterium]